MLTYNFPLRPYSWANYLDCKNSDIDPKPALSEMTLATTKKTIGIYQPLIVKPPAIQSVSSADTEAINAIRRTFVTFIQTSFCY
ncbi:hypothetical protein FJD32_024835 (plasmid) [Shewanella sp. LC6]|nr:hypothetical protein FJD32_024835 [Shewanella sp. LC6]TPE64097.1 hypothetical protein FJD33_03075 [Shewanella sp. LC2]